MRGLRKSPRALRLNKLFFERPLLKLDVDTVYKVQDRKLEQLKFKPVKFFREILD